VISCVWYYPANIRTIPENIYYFVLVKRTNKEKIGYAWIKWLFVFILKEYCVSFINPPPDHEKLMIWKEWERLRVIVGITTGKLINK